MNKNDDAMVNKELFYMRTIVLKKKIARALSLTRF